MDHLFKASDPLEENTMGMINSYVLVHHFERDYQQHGLPGERKYDLGVPKDNLKNLAGNGICVRNHHNLVISEGAPREAKESMMVS